jgi:hypothetical protein
VPLPGATDQACWLSVDGGERLIGIARSTQSAFTYRTYQRKLALCLVSNNMQNILLSRRPPCTGACVSASWVSPD